MKKSVKSGVDKKQVVDQLVAEWSGKYLNSFIIAKDEKDPVQLVEKLRQTLAEGSLKKIRKLWNSEQGLEVRS